jgi:hypothetical protein
MFGAGGGRVARGGAAGRGRARPPAKERDRGATRAQMGRQGSLTKGSKTAPKLRLQLLAPQGAAPPRAVPPSSARPSKACFVLLLVWRFHWHSGAQGCRVRGAAARRSKRRGRGARGARGAVAPGAAQRRLRRRRRSQAAAAGARGSGKRRLPPSLAYAGMKCFGVSWQRMTGRGVARPAAGRAGGVGFSAGGRQCGARRIPRAG